MPPWSLARHTASARSLKPVGSRLTITRAAPLCFASAPPPDKLRAMTRRPGTGRRLRTLSWPAAIRPMDVATVGFPHQKDHKDADDVADH